MEPRLERPTTKITLPLTGTSKTHPLLPGNTNKHLLTTGTHQELPPIILHTNATPSNEPILLIKPPLLLYRVNRAKWPEPTNSVSTVTKRVMMTVTVRIRIPANPLQNLTGLKQLDVTYAIKLVILLLTALLNTNVRSLGPPLQHLSCLLLNPLQPQPKSWLIPFFSNIFIFRATLCWDCWCSFCTCCYHCIPQNHWCYLIQLFL